MVEKLRAKELREQQIVELLTEIRDALRGVAPPLPPPTGGAVSVVSPTLDELGAMIDAALEKHGVLKRATDWYVKTIDLSTANSAPKEMTDLENALALTIYLNTGTFTLYLQKNDDTHKITVSPLTYPQTLLIDWFDIGKVWIVNTSQSGLSATIIKFFRA